jgi:hypothetical protein
MALMIAEALVPVFFVMFLGYFAGVRRIFDNQHVDAANTACVGQSAACLERVSASCREGNREIELVPSRSEGR